MRRPHDILLIPVEGDLDVTTAPGLRSYIERRIDEGCRRVVLDLAATSYVDSFGMSLILSLARRLREAGGLLSLVNVGDVVYRMLCISRLVDFIPVTDRSPKPPIPALDPAVRPLWRTTLRVDPDGLRGVRERVGELLARTGLTPDEDFDLTLAAGEALGNAVDHTCAEGVLLTLTVYPDRVVVEVTDCGEGFELAADEEPPCARGDEEAAERGRGIRLMRMLADSVEIRRKPAGGGTVVRLVKMYTPLPA